MALPNVTSREQWLAARRALLDAEKALTWMADAIATQRRMLPMVEVDEPYSFTGQDGPVALRDLFEERRQLIVYHFMFHPDWEDACESCTAGRDDELGPGVLRHLHTRDTTYALVSRAPFDKLERWRELRGWDIPWYSTDDGPFSYDFGATIDERLGSATFNYRGRQNDQSGHDAFFDSDQPFDMPGRSCFLCDGDWVFHTYSHFARATEGTQTPYTLLDLTALGRQEDWEKPEGRADEAPPPKPAFER